MSKQLTIRGVSNEIGRRLEGLSHTRGQSLNATVLEILGSAVGVDERRLRLARHTTWTEEDLVEFNEALAAQRTIDAPLDEHFDKTPSVDRTVLTVRRE